MDFHFHSLAINWARSGCCPVDVDVNGVYAIKILASPSTRKEEGVESNHNGSNGTCGCNCNYPNLCCVLPPMWLQSLFIDCAFAALSSPPKRYPSHIQAQSHLILNPHRFIANYPATRQWSIAAKFMDTNFGNKMPLGGRTFPFPFSWYLSVPNPLSPSPFSLASALKSGSTSIFDFVIVSHCLVGALLMVISWNKWGDNWKWTQ